MVKEKYKKFVINYEPFKWEMEVNPSEFRDNIKDKHRLINYLKNEKNDLEKTVIKFYQKIGKIMNTLRFC